MTLVQLRHFIDLAQTGSFSSSARRMHITQPALSRSISSLEEEFGHALFDRIGRKNELTAFGRQVVERARVLVEQAWPFLTDFHHASHARRPVCAARPAWHRA